MVDKLVVRKTNITMINSTNQGKTQFASRRLLNSSISYIGTLGYQNEASRVVSHVC